MLRIRIGMEPHYFWDLDPGVSKLGPDPNLNIRENITECGEQIVNMKINIIFFGLKEGVRCYLNFDYKVHAFMVLIHIHTLPWCLRRLTLKRTTSDSLVFYILSGNTQQKRQTLKKLCTLS